MSKKLKETNFFKLFQSNFHLAYGIKDKKGYGLVGKEKKDKYNVSTNRAKYVAARVVLGPELNILFLGIPFLITTAKGAATNAYRNAQPAQPAAAPPPNAPKTLKIKATAQGYAGQAPIVLQQPDILIPDTSVSPSATADQLPPLIPAPFSDQNLTMRDILVKWGISVENATAIADGALYGEDLSEHLNEKEAEIFKAYLGSLSSAL